MSVDGKESWIENRVMELFEEIQRRNPHLSLSKISEDFFFVSPQTILWLCSLAYVLYHLHSLVIL